MDSTIPNICAPNNVTREDFPMKELNSNEAELVSGGDQMTWGWGHSIGSALRSAWDSFSEYARSDDASRDVIA